MIKLELTSPDGHLSDSTVWSRYLTVNTTRWRIVIEVHVKLTAHACVCDCVTVCVCDHVCVCVRVCESV